MTHDDKEKTEGNGQEDFTSSNILINKPLGYFDRERMEKALNSPMFEMPTGLSREERTKYILSIVEKHK